MTTIYSDITDKTWRFIVMKILKTTKPFAGLGEGNYCTISYTNEADHWITSPHHLTADEAKEEAQHSVRCI